MATTQPNNNADAFDCITCDMVMTFEEQAGGYIETVFIGLHSGMVKVMLSAAALWIVIQGIKLVLGTTKLPEIVKEIFFIIIAYGVLSVQPEHFVNIVFINSLAVMSGVSAAVLDSSVLGVEIPDSITGLGRLAAVVEAALASIVKISITIATSWSLTNMMSILYAILLFVPYFMMLVVYLSKCVVGLFRIVIISAFMPFLILCFGFKGTRDMSIAGIKTILASIGVLFAASLALGFIMFASASLKLTEKGVDVEALIGFDSPEFILAVILGWVGTALMTEGVGIANSIMQSALSNTAVGIMSAGIATSAAAVGSRLLKSPGGMASVAGYTAAAASGGGAGLRAAIGNRSSALIDKYKSGYSGANIPGANYQAPPPSAAPNLSTNAAGAAPKNNPSFSSRGQAILNQK